ncbi:MAG: acetyl-CoA acetyltransferase, partial [Candidatus Binataceae bacterium]
HMVPVSARQDLAACPGARIAGQAALDAGSFAIEGIDLIELYSCFPSAVETYAAALGLPLSSPTRPLTITGGMPFAGGPFNNYVLQATCRAAELLREGAGRTALVSSVSGMLTKQGFGLWSVDPAPRGFVNADLTESVARKVKALEVLDEFTGEGVVAGYTVIHGRNQAPRGIALIDVSPTERALTTTEDPTVLASMQEVEWVGRQVVIDKNVLGIY